MAGVEIAVKFAAGRKISSSRCEILGPWVLDGGEVNERV